MVEAVRSAHPHAGGGVPAATMRTADFDYVLPPELIAQVPAEPRDCARLLVLDRFTQVVRHHIFRELPALLRPGDVLIANDSRVLPARLSGRRAGTGGAVEALLLTELAGDEWVALVRPARRVRAGETLVFGDGLLEATVLECLDGGERRLGLSARDASVREAIFKIGVAPLPPYIHAPLADPERYQTVYGRVEGSVAAPTAGLHFTPELLARLLKRGIDLRYVTLHVGPGTFKPVRSEDIARHRMHAERVELDLATAEALNAARASGRRLVAVGTTAVRVLEAASSDGVPRPLSGSTNIFITPGYRFRSVDAMITNFHLPRSTLLMLVSAFAGKTSVDVAYAEAIAQRYRFYSFGDAMLIE